AAAAREAPLLNPLPSTGFDVATILSCRVDAMARVCVRQSYYSVPARYAGRRLTARLGGARWWCSTGPPSPPSTSGRCTRAARTWSWTTYLEVLTRKPGALSGATALAAARAGGGFTAEHQRFWDAARKALGDGPGTRALVGVLLLHRTLPSAAVTAGMTAAAAVGRFDADIVAVQARTAISAGASPPPSVPLPDNAPGTAALGRPAPDLAGYDQLLTEVSA
ncbi:MAG: IS21 family transposase, partial [Actinomycetales bacterium]